MKTLLTARFAILLTCSLLLSVPSSAQSPAVPIQDFFKSYFEENLKDEPENATGVGRHDYDDRWSDLSKAGRDAHLAHLRSRLADLNKYDFAKLSEQDQLSARLLNYELTSQIESNDISTHLLRVGQLYGFHNRVYLTMDRMPARTLKDYQNILARLHGIPALIDQNLAILDGRLTTTRATPEEIHKTGEAELQRLEAEMLATARETGFTGTLAEFEKKLDAMPEQHFRSKEDMLIYSRNVAKIIEPQLPVLFKRIPILLYGVRPIPPDREAATATNAQAPSPDGSTPGWFNLNTYQPEKQVRYDKQALVLHEAVPGHVFQGAVARSMTGLPEFRRFYGNSAYAEGWALYVESLGGQLGLYTDPYDRFGQLASERFRAVRLVVDTGIHSMGWTREQALAFLQDHAPQESVAEIDRYISWPGQALAYKMGQLEIMKLRKEAQLKLGPKFDIREFHDVVLRDGALPLELLDEQGQKYINSK